MRYKILNILVLVTLASCTETIYIEKDAEKSPYLNGECKTPIAVGISYNEGSVQTRATRATNGSFASDDNLIAYVRHVTTTGSGAEATINPVSGTGVGPTMATLTVNSSNIAEADNHTANNLTVSPTLYWDDFSNSNVADGAADLRTSGHYLQSYYGYCYNGAEPSSYSLTENTGELSWTILKDQNTGTNLTKSDLLWSSSQDPVPYAHATFNGGVEHGILTIPYSHAMSKVTIEVNCDESFTKTAAVIFNETSIDLIKMYSSAKVTAPTQAILATDTNTNTITMKKNSISEATATEKKKSSYEAIIIPIKLTNDLLFATIKDVDGNNYDIKITDALLSTAPTGEKTWNSELNNGSTKSGVNYKLVVTISKQEIKVVATIADWTTVNAAAEGEINFTTDIAGPDENTFETTFDLYSKSAVTTTETYNYLTTNNRNTVCTWDGTNRKWTYAPTLYWEKEGDNRYFRAVSPQVNNRQITSTDGAQTVEMTAGEGTGYDFCWGTSQAYKNSQNQDVAEGEAVEPRTSNVGLQFYHKTSKVKIVLQTPPTDAEGKVVIKDAKIQLTNLYTTNTVNLHTGVISTFADSEIRSAEVFTVSSSEDKRPKASTYTPGSADPAVDDKAETAELFMIPQEIPSDKASTDDKNEEARLIITLTDGTTYSLALNSCKTVVKDENGNIEKDENGNDKYVAVGQWDEGKSYVYYIRLTKEEILFIALIKDWEEKETNGSATMDWDDVDPDLFEGGLIEKRGDGWKIQ